MVSVIIPTLNAGPKLNDLLNALEGQSVPSEIIVVDSSSTDGTQALARSHGVRLIMIEKCQFNHGRTRNLAADEASGDYLVFLSQDVVPLREDCLKALLRPLEDSSIGATFGRQVPSESARPTEQFARLFNYGKEPMVKTMDSFPQLGIKTFFFSNACSAVRRDAYVRAGRFPESLLMFEDMLFAARLLQNSYAISYVPEAEVLHSHDHSLMELCRRYFAAGKSFAMNPWFLPYSATGREGARFLAEQISYLRSQGESRWVPYALLEAACKLILFRAGLLAPGGRHRQGGET